MVKICHKCGLENADNAKFCYGCGTELCVGASIETERNQSIDKSKNIICENLSKYAKWICLASIVFVLLTIILLVTGQKQKKILVNDYIEFKVSGHDGSGKIDAYINWERMSFDYGDGVTFKSHAYTDFGGGITMLSPVEAITEFVIISPENRENLSNGDIINYTVTINEEIYDFINCSLAYKDGSYTVRGLAPISFFDAFENVEINFYGLTPEPMVSISYTGGELDDADFYYKSEDKIYNGDSITVYIDEDAVKNCEDKYGMTPSVLSKEYKVEGLRGAITKVSDLSRDDLEYLQQKAESEYRLAAEHGDSEFQSITYVGNYYLTHKKNGYGDNKLFLIYKPQYYEYVVGHNGEVFEHTSNFLWFVEYDNITLDENGNLAEDITMLKPPLGAFYTVKSGVPVIINFNTCEMDWRYVGYETLDDLYYDVVVSNYEYNCENNIDESCLDGIGKSENRCVEEDKDYLDSFYTAIITSLYDPDINSEEFINKICSGNPYTIEDFLADEESEFVREILATIGVSNFQHSTYIKKIQSTHTEDAHIYIQGNEEGRFMLWITTTDESANGYTGYCPTSAYDADFINCIHIGSSDFFESE